MDTKEQILATLLKAEKPLKNSEIAQILGVEQKAIEKAIKQLKTEDKVISPIRCFWTAK